MIDYEEATGGGLDDIEISVASDIGVPYIYYKEFYPGAPIERNEWDAGILNHKQSYTTDNIFILENQGQSNLEIKSIGFTTNFFITNLGEGTIIAPNQSINFGMSFIAVEENTEIQDALRIEFTEGQVYEFPIKGSALGATSYCYTFEDATPFATDYISDFRTYDQDGAPTLNFGFEDETNLLFPGLTSPYAFVVINWEMLNEDWKVVHPRSGKQVLLASGLPESNTNVNTNDWLISKDVYPLENAQLRFYARSLADDDLWNKDKLTVLVSTTDNEISSFTAVPDFNGVDIPRHKEVLEYNDYTECIVDLSAYANQKIYIAILHQADKWGMGLVLDDIYFENFHFSTGGDGIPEFLTTPITEAKVGENYSYTFTVWDTDEDLMNVQIVGKPDWMTYTEEENSPGMLKGTLSGTPLAVNQNLIRIEVTDGTHERVQQFTLNITNPNSIETVKEGLSIYPNPAIDFVTINGAYTGIVTLTDLAGKQVYEGENVDRVPVGNLLAGVYILKVYTKNGVYTTTVIKK